MALEKTLETTLAALAQNQLTQLFFADVKKKNQGEWIKRLTLEHTSYVEAAAALPSGQVVSGSVDNTLKVWDVQNGQCLQTLQGHTDVVRTVAALSNGQVVSGSRNEIGSRHNIKVWEIPSILTLTVQEQQALLQAVLTNTSLQSLNLSHIALSTLPQGFELLHQIIQTHPTLHTLDLSHTGLTDTQLIPLLSALYNTKRIKNMAIEGNSLSHAGSLVLQQYFDNLNHLVSPIPLPSSIPKPQHTLKPSSLATLPFDLQHIAWNTLTVGNLLGHGGYGDVYQGQWQNVSVAIKELHLKTLSPALSADFEQEAKIMAQCHFPHVVRLYGVCVESGHIAMVMEYMPKESLYQVFSIAQANGLDDDSSIYPGYPGLHLPAFIQSRNLANQYTPYGQFTSKIMGALSPILIRHKSKAKLIFLRYLGRY